MVRGLRLGGVALALVVGVLALLSSGSAGIAWAAASPKRATTITACVNKKTGALRIATTCHKTERKLTWSITGPAGATGPAGPAGPAGAAGTPAPTYSAGTGLTLANSTFSLSPTFLTNITTACASGDAITQLSATAAPTCTAVGGSGGGAPSGSAGGGLSGTYPNPTLNISDSDNSGTSCNAGDAVAGVSSAAVLTCVPGVYTDSHADTTVGQGITDSAFGSAGNDTAVGTGALSDSAGAEYETAIGSFALHNDTTGGGNDALGTTALYYDTTGGDNDALGTYALFDDTTGGDNDAFGQGALYDNLTGTGNAAFGFQALTDEDNTSTTQPDSAFGYEAGENITTGHNDVAIGGNALNSVTSASDDIALGSNAGSALGTSANGGNIDIGSPGVAGDGGILRIGTSGDITQAFIQGIYGQTISSGEQVEVGSNGQLGVVTSSAKYKTDIRPLGAGVQKLLMALKPVTFHYKQRYIKGQRDVTEFGLIAQQVAKVDPDLVVYGPHHVLSSVAYQDLPPLLLALLQRQVTKAIRQQTEINRLGQEVNELRGLVLRGRRH